MAAPHPKRPESGRTGLKGRHAVRAPDLPVLFRPDYNRRLRNRTESADPADCSAGARGLWRSLAITAGGDFHPAPRTRSDRNPTDAIKATLIKPYNHFRQPNGQLAEIKSNREHSAAPTPRAATRRRRPCQRRRRSAGDPHLPSPAEYGSAARSPKGSRQ